MPNTLFCLLLLSLRSQVYRILFPAITDKIADQRQASKALGAESLMGLDPETFYELFPFREFTGGAWQRNLSAGTHSLAGHTGYEAP